MLAIFPIGDIRLTAHYYWESRYLGGSGGFDPSQQDLLLWHAQPADLWLADLGASGADMTLFMNNVANTEACIPEYNGVLNSVPNGTFGTPGTSGVLQCVPLPPRMTGMSLEYKF